MVLRFLFLFLSLTSCAFINAQNLGTLTYTDSYDVNHLIDKSLGTESTIYFGCDYFRFLNNEQLTSCAIFLESFLKGAGLTPTGAFEFQNRNTLITKLKIPSDLRWTLGHLWQKNYLEAWKMKLAEFQTDTLRNTFEQIEDALYYSQVIMKDRKFDNENFVTHLGIAVASSTEFKIPESLVNTVQQGYYDGNRISAFNTIAIAKGSTEMQKAVCGPTKHTDLKALCSLYILSEYSKQKGLSSEIRYGVNKTNLVLKGGQFHSKALSPEFTADISEEVFQSLKTAVKNNFLSNLSVDKMFFFSQMSWSRINNILNDLKLSDYNGFVKKINDSSFTYSIPYESYKVNDSLTLNSVQEYTLSKSVKMKSNSSKIASTADSSVLNQIGLLLQLNPNKSVAIQGYADTKEYTKIKKQDRELLIAEYKEQIPGYKISKKVNLGLVRSLELYNALNSQFNLDNTLRCLAKYDQYGTNQYVRFSLLELY